MVTRLGSDYGGWHIDLDAVRDGSVVLDLGVGGDDSFARELLARKRVTVLLVDPSETTAAMYAKEPPPVGAVYLRAAVTSDGLAVDMVEGGSQSDRAAWLDMPGEVARTYTAAGVSLVDLLRSNDVSLVKMDIEGYEFAVLHQCLGVRQVAVEFHTVQMPERKPDCLALVEKFTGAGYKVIHQTERDEYTFLRDVDG